MANQEHLDILKQGVDVWNKWREEQENTRPDLSGINLFLKHPYAEENMIFRENELYNIHLRGVDLSGINFTEVNLRGANLQKVILRGAKLEGADLTKANLRNAKLEKAILFRTILKEAELIGAKLNQTWIVGADFSGAVLSFATLSQAELDLVDLRGANLYETDLSKSHLTRVDLRGAVLIETNLNEAIITHCSVYGVSTWKLQLEGAKQANLLITNSDYDEPIITVDNLEIAQFINLLLDNKKIRDVIDTITSKVVLILGRFTDERKAVLDALRDELQKRNYSPVLFDFEKPASRDLTETVSTLAHMARFVLADITEPRSIPQELQSIIPHLPSVPIQPLLQVSDREYGMFEHFVSYPWVQPVYCYRDVDDLLRSIQEHIIDPAERQVRELTLEKAKRLERP